VINEMKKDKKMKAAILEKPGEIEYKEVDKPYPKAGEVLLNVKAVSICGSDILRTYYGAAHHYPLVLGHEAAGIIADVGDDVLADIIGSRVAVAPLIPCMRCHACQRGIYSACQCYSFVGSRQQGCFAEYVALPRQNLVELPDTVGFDIGAIIEPATVALHGLERVEMRPGMKVAVFGVGSVGLCAVQWARIKGASEIIAIDLVDSNLHAALALGADQAFNPSAVNTIEQVLATTGDGVDIAVEVSGAPKALIQAVRTVRPRGKILCVGNLPADARLPSQLVEHIIRQELAMHGTWMSYSAPFPGHEWTETLQAVQKGELVMKDMISHHFSLSETQMVFEKMNDHSFAHQKIILHPESPE